MDLPDDKSVRIPLLPQGKRILLNIAGQDNDTTENRTFPFPHKRESMA